MNFYVKSIIRVFKPFAHQRQPERTHRWGLALVMGALLLLSACGGLGGEPRIVATFPAPTAVPESSLPAQHPDLAQGQAIFTENCTRCHGENGQGDGEFVLTGQLRVPPPDFTDQERTRAQVASAWFDVVTHGRIENLMPPWRDSLSEAERWSVTLYAYTLNYQQAQIAEGASVWAEHCAACHGDTGAGDGPQADADTPPMDLTQPGALVEQSDERLFDLLSGGEDAVHAFADTLDASQRWAVIAYARTLAVENSNIIGQEVLRPVATPEVASETTAAPEAETVATQGVIRGQINNGTENGTISETLTVTLRVFDAQLSQQTFETPVSEDGSFVFPDVPLRPDNAYIATTLYQDRLFTSDMRSGDPATTVLELPITVFETTNDPAVVSISSVLVQISGAANGLQVAQLLTFSNRSDRVFSLDETIAGDRHPSVSISIPSGAQNINTADETNRFVMSDDGTALTDTQPLFPGDDHIVHVIYTLPYSGEAQFELPIHYDLEGSVSVMMQPDSLQLASDQLPLVGTQTMGNATFTTYGADLVLPAGEMLTFDVTGASTAPAPVLTTPNMLPYALIAAGGLSILIAAVLFYRGRQLPSTTVHRSTQQALIDKIAALDDLHEKGIIGVDDYARERERLKQALAKDFDKHE